MSAAKNEAGSSWPDFDEILKMSQPESEADTASVDDDFGWNEDNIKLDFMTGE